jgi:hypothetical protein
MRTVKGLLIAGALLIIALVLVEILADGLQHAAIVQPIDPFVLD